MDYTISQLAKLSGVSSRTLRYYDQIGLLEAKRQVDNDYRVYGKKEVDLLQQILFYRELEFSLDDIRHIIYDENFDVNTALDNHLEALLTKRDKLDDLIETVKLTKQYNKGEIDMSDTEKFEAFKKDLIDTNEEKYGEEIREKYGKETIDESNKKMSHMSHEEYDAIEAKTNELNEKLALAVKNSDPASAEGQEIAELHKNWLIAVWPDGLYDPEKHMGLTDMYVADERFKAYYEAIAKGTAEYLQAAVKIYYS